MSDPQQLNTLQQAVCPTTHSPTLLDHLVYIAKIFFMIDVDIVLTFMVFTVIGGVLLGLYLLYKILK